VVCVSEAVRSSLVEWKPSLKGRCEVLHNGIDLGRFESGERTDRSVPVVISVGRLTASKGYATALRAIALLSDLDLRYVLVGDGPQRKRLEKLARHLGVWKRVRFAGRSHDVPGLLARADVFLHPSRSEGFGISVLEAMASGLPVVCTDLPALREITGPFGESALRSSPDHRAMAAHLRALLQNPGLRDSMGRSGRARAEGFDIQSVAQSHIALYEHVAGNG
jgi:glycosyltransferase involved in cell wall biosynthesis